LFKVRKGKQMKRLNCVLIIDDDRVSNYVSENVIRGMGMSSMINTVTGGLAGLEYVKYQCNEENDFACPDLIVLDINMRLINGVEFVKEYRRMNLPSHSVIVILSTLPLREEQKSELINMGVTHFYTKPLNAEKISEIMEDYFSHV
jgi:CheY-like chemotaxis protein